MPTIPRFTLKRQVYSWLQTQRFSGLAQELFSCCLTVQRKPADGLLATEFWSLKLYIYIIFTVYIDLYVYQYIENVFIWLQKSEATRQWRLQTHFCAKERPGFNNIEVICFLRESTPCENLSSVKFWRSPLQQILCVHLLTNVAFSVYLRLRAQNNGSRSFRWHQLSRVTQREKSSSLDRLMVSGQRHCWDFFFCHLH